MREGPQRDDGEATRVAQVSDDGGGGQAVCETGGAVDVLCKVFEVLVEEFDAMVAVSLGLVELVREFMQPGAAEGE